MNDSGLLGGELRTAVRDMDPDVDDSRRIDRIRALEELKSAVAAAQAREVAAFAASQRATQRAARVPEDKIGQGVAGQVGLAMRVSPFRARRYVGWASILVSELPRTFEALAAGRTSEWRAILVARESAWLSRVDRAVVDRELAPRLEGLGSRRVEAEAKRLAYRLDPAGAVAKVRGAESDRRVSLRPAPETMARLTGLLPVAQGVAAHTAVARDAASLIAAGDSRGRGQIMADLLVERLTGQSRARDVPVEVTLVMTPTTLLDDAEGRDVPEAEPAELADYGPIPAGLARELITGAGADTSMWLRRVFTAPDTGELLTMDTRRRLFTAAQRHFIRLRDRWCRTPWCDAPIAHADHVVPAAQNGATSIGNAQGLCQACNYAKQVPGWSARYGPDGAIETTTPTGHRYRSRAPDPPRRTPSRRGRPIMIDYDWHVAA